MGTEGLPAAIFANSERGGTATVVKNESLVVIFKVFADGGKKLIREIAIFGEILTIFEVYKVDFGSNGGRFSFLIESDNGVTLISKIKILD